MGTVPLYRDDCPLSLALLARSKKSSIMSNEIKDWLNTNLWIYKQKLTKVNSTNLLYKPLANSILIFLNTPRCLNAFLKHTYSLSSSSSAIRRISNSSTIFPECPRMVASESLSIDLYQSAAGLSGLKLVDALTAEHRAYNITTDLTWICSPYINDLIVNHLKCSIVTQEANVK